MSTSSPFTLAQKNILITGASSGIGRATAIQCARMGATVFITGRNQQRLTETFTQLPGVGHQMVCADLTRAADVERLVSMLTTIDGLVLSFGVIGLVPLLAYTEEKLTQMQQVNLNAPVLLLRHLLKKRKFAPQASVVFVSSAAGVYRVTPANGIYASTKSALDAMMRTAALELAKRGIRCNSVNPAIIETEGSATLSWTDEQREAECQKYPLRRFGRPEDVAYGIIYLLSDASGWVTGTSIKIDGGRTLS